MALTHAALLLAFPTAFRLRIRRAGCGRQCPTAATVMDWTPHRRKSRGDDNSAVEVVTVGVFRRQSAALPPIPRRAQRKAAAGCRCRTAEAFRASRENQNSTAKK